MMRLPALFLCGFCLVVPSRIAAAEPEPLTFDVSGSRATVSRGQIFQVVIASRCEMVITPHVFRQ